MKNQNVLDLLDSIEKNADILKRLHINSHINGRTGKEKVTYNTFQSAQTAAMTMEAKYHNQYVAYRCFYCDGFHIGKNKITYKKRD